AGRGRAARRQRRRPRPRAGRGLPQRRRLPRAGRGALAAVRAAPARARARPLGGSFVSLTQISDVAVSGLLAQRTRMLVTASNLANAQTTRTAEGGPYQRRDP